MRYFLFLILVVGSPIVTAIEWEEQRIFKGANGGETLRVISSTDSSVFAPIIDSFLSAHPYLNIEYRVASSTGIYNEYRQSPDQYDLVISSAMDLQLKLVNDGYAFALDDVDHPEWAQWRQSLFGFTLEPASIVVNKSAFGNLPVPQSRQEMIEVLRANPDVFRGKIGTYDVRQSGLGYLFATQDARASDNYWRLMEIFGNLETRLYCCSGAMIEDLAQGRIAIAFNVLGSYAAARSDLAEKIEIVLPSDFPNIMMRTALIAKSTRRVRSAGLFLRYLVSSRWNDDAGQANTLPSLHLPSIKDKRSIIALEPGLMIFLDRLKRQSFIKEWENAVIH